MKHLSPLFELQLTELQGAMHRNTKCMLDLYEKIHRKDESLSRPNQEHYFDEHDEDSEGKAKQIKMSAV